MFGSGDGGTTGNTSGGGSSGDGGGGDGGGGGTGQGGGGPVEDDDGIIIWPQPLNVQMGQPVGSQGMIAQFSPPADSADDDFSASATYVDAQNNTQTLPVYVDGGYVEVEPETIINTPGDFDVNLTVTDDDTGEPADADTELVVSDAELIGQNVPPLKEQAGTSFTVKVAGVSSSDKSMPWTALEATIDWDDGTTSPGAIADTGTPGQFNVMGTHTYASPNDAGSPYQVQTTVDEVANPGNTAFATTTIDTSVPTVSVTENGQAFENQAGNPDYASSDVAETFTFTRTGDTSNLLTVPLNVGGSAVEGTNYTWSPSSVISQDAVNFDPGQSAVTATIVPIDDGIPGWTKNVAVSIPNPAQSDGQHAATFMPDPSNSTATGLIGDSDLSIGLDNSSLKATPSGQGNLVALHLNIPTDTRYGATIDLSVSEPWEVDVWDSPDGSGPLVLGGGIPSLSWRVGFDTIPTTLYVGAVKASQAPGDITFTVTDDDTGASSPGITQNRATSQPATAQWSTWNEVAPDILQTIQTISDLDYSIAQTLSPLITSLDQVAANAAFLMAPLSAQNLRNIQASTLSVLFNGPDAVALGASVSTQLLSKVTGATGFVGRAANGRFAVLSGSLRTTARWVGPASLAIPIADWAANVTPKIQNIEYISSLLDSVSAGEAYAKNAALALISAFNGAVEDGAQVDNQFASLDGQPCEANVNEVAELRSSLQTHLQQLQEYNTAKQPGWQQLPSLATQAMNLLQTIVSWIQFEP